MNREDTIKRAAGIALRRAAARVETRDQCPYPIGRSEHSPLFCGRLTTMMLQVRVGFPPHGYCDEHAAVLLEDQRITAWRIERSAERATDGA